MTEFEVAIQASRLIRRIGRIRWEDFTWTDRARIMRRAANDLRGRRLRRDAWLDMQIDWNAE